MKGTQDLFYALLKVALGHQMRLDKAPSDQEWYYIYNECVCQALAGIALAGIQKLPGDQYPPQVLLFQWIGLSEQIRQRNDELDNQTAVIWKKLNDRGLDVAVLKGQGVACEYGSLSALRQSGDIDIWVKGGYQKVCNFVQLTHPTCDVAYHRFHYDYFDDTEVELHHRPTLMRNLLDNKKLARWYNSFGKDSFVYLKDKGFAVPSPEFNRIFILTHIYRHFLFEGIGFRQIMDCYFVLKNSMPCVNDEKRILIELKMHRFAMAIMWILHNKLGLEEQYLICGMNEEEGRFVLQEIEQTGNFGRGDTRYKYKFFLKLRRQIAHGKHLFLHYPSEVLWTPIWLIYHKIWKWYKKRNIRKMW